MPVGPVRGVKITCSMAAVACVWVCIACVVLGSMVLGIMGLVDQQLIGNTGHGNWGLNIIC